MIIFVSRYTTFGGVSLRMLGISEIFSPIRKTGYVLRAQAKTR